MAKPAQGKPGPPLGVRLRVTASTQAARFLTPLLVDIARRGIHIHELGGGLWSLDVWMPVRLWRPRTIARLRDACEQLSRYFSDPAPPEFQWERREWPVRLPRGEKRFFRPHQATERLWVSPAGTEVPTTSGQWVLELEVGRARGTGIHPATHSSLRLLQFITDLAPPTDALDVGTGTGILALAAARWGVARIQAIDVDPHAVRVARRNVRRNGLQGSIKVRCRDVAQEGGRYPLVIAHISAKMLARRTAALIRCLSPGGWMILEGIRQRQTQTILQRVTPQLELAREDREAWWTALLLKREME